MYIGHRTRKVYSVQCAVYVYCNLAVLVSLEKKYYLFLINSLERLQRFREGFWSCIKKIVLIIIAFKWTRYMNSISVISV